MLAQAAAAPLDMRTLLRLVQAVAVSGQPHPAAPKLCRTQAHALQCWLCLLMRPSLARSNSSSTIRSRFQCRQQLLHAALRAQRLMSMTCQRRKQQRRRASHSSSAGRQQAARPRPAHGSIKTSCSRSRTGYCSLGTRRACLHPRCCPTCCAVLSLWLPRYEP